MYNASYTHQVKMNELSCDQAGNAQMKHVDSLGWPVCPSWFELSILYCTSLRFVSFHKAIPKNPGATMSTRRFI